MLKISKGAKPNVVVPEQWMLAASRGPFSDILQQLLPYSSRSQVDKCLVEAASLGHTEVAVLLAGHSKIDVSAAVTEAIERGHFELAGELVRRYPSKRLIENAFFKSAEHGNASLIREFINNVDMGSITSAIIGAAQEEKFEVVDILLEHASPDAIQRIAPMMLGKAAARAVFERVLRYMPQLASGLLNKALKVADYDAMQKLLPLTTLDDIQTVFPNACTDGNFKAVSLFTPFTRAKAADQCFRELAGQEGTPPALLEQLLPHVSRNLVFSIHNAPERWTRLKESTRAAIRQRVAGFSREIAFVHSFRVGFWYLREVFARKEAGLEGKKYGLELPTLCNDVESCAKELEVLTKTQLSNAAVEEAMANIELVPDDEALVQVVPFLVPLATPFICTSLMESSPGVSALVPAIVSACTGKALKYVVTKEFVHHAYEGSPEPLKALLPFASPQQLLRGLQMAIREKKMGAFETILEALSTSQADEILRSVVFESSGDGPRYGDAELLEKGVLQKASKHAIDVSLLHLSRRQPWDKEPVTMLSKYASEEGKAAAEKLIKWLWDDSFAW